MKTLPTYLIIGCPNSATTTLYRCLTQHPKIQSAKREELHFFDNDRIFCKGIKYYASLFMPCNEKEIIGEATSTYIYSNTALERIKLHLPEVKLIIVIRNPIARIYSQFYRYLRKCTLKAETPISNNLIEFIKTKQNKPETKGKKIGNSFLGRSVYIYHLNKWIKAFSEKQVKIICFEEFIENPQQTANEIFKFLKLPKTEIKIKYYRPDRRTLKLDFDLMSPETKKYLQEYYQTYNQELYKLLNKNLHWED